jgi:hypothetical protein
VAAPASAGILRALGAPGPVALRAREGARVRTLLVELVEQRVVRAEARRVRAWAELVALKQCPARSRWESLRVSPAAMAHCQTAGPRCARISKLACAPLLYARRAAVRRCAPRAHPSTRRASPAFRTTPTRVRRVEPKPSPVRTTGLARATFPVSLVARADGRGLGTGGLSTSALRNFTNILWVVRICASRRD